MLPVVVRSATVDSYSLYVYGLKDVEEPPLYVSIACQETDGGTFLLLIHQPGESSLTDGSYCSTNSLNGFSSFTNQFIYLGSRGMEQTYLI